MTHNLASLKAAIAAAPAIAFKGTLERLVPFNDLVKYHPTDWLYTSGKPSRYNPNGVNCIYFGETVGVAQEEYKNRVKGLAVKNQPVTTYSAAIELRRVLDLTDAATLKALKVNAKDLLKSWRRAKQPTLTQLLGQAVNETGLFSAVRFPSQVTAKHGQKGVNLVIFRDCVKKPDSVCILGPTRKPLQRWP